MFLRFGFHESFKYTHLAEDLAQGSGVDALDPKSEKGEPKR